MGNWMGVACIVISVLLLPVTGGISLVGVVVACFAFGGQRAVDNKVSEMEAAPEGRDGAFLSGCVTVVLGSVLTLLVIYMAFYLWTGGTL